MINRPTRRATFQGAVIFLLIQALVPNPSSTLEAESDVVEIEVEPSEHPQEEPTQEPEAERSEEPKAEESEAPEVEGSEAPEAPDAEKMEAPPVNRNKKTAVGRMFPEIQACLDGISKGGHQVPCSNATNSAIRVWDLLQKNDPDSSFYVSDCDVLLDYEGTGLCALKGHLYQRMVRFIAAIQEIGHDTVSPAKADDLDRARQFLAREFADFHAANKAEMAVVLRGGLSLGNYQAGFLYYVSEFLKERSERVKSRHSTAPRRGFATVAGASAGGLNAVISSFDGCLKKESSPEQSLYYKGWTNVGMFGRHGRAGLVVDGREAESSLGLLSKRPLLDAVEMVLSHAASGSVFESKCPGVNLGITATRLDPELFSLYSKVDGSKAKGKGGLKTVLGALKQAEKMLFTVEFDPDPSTAGPGDSVMGLKPLRPFIPFEKGSDGSDPRAAAREFYLAYGSGYDSIDSVEDRNLGLEDLAPVLYATAAFPMAFSPEELTYTRIGRDGRPKGVETARFVDGGIFDNTPLGLAIAMDRWDDARDAEIGYLAQVPEGASAKMASAKQVATQAAWLDSHEGSCLAHRSDPLEKLLCDVLPPKPRDYLFIEPTVVDWSYRTGPSSLETPNGGPRKRAILPTVAKFTGSFLGTSMGASLVATAKANPFITKHTGDTILPRLLVPERHLPIASTQLENFMGFFERDFRVFDFYVGLLDAERFMARDAVYGGIDVLPNIESSRYLCMRDYYRNSEEMLRFIEHPDLPTSCFELEPSSDAELLSGVHDVAALTAEVIARMDEDWSKNESRERQAQMMAVKRRLSGKNFRALIVAMHNLKGWMVSKKYEEDKEFEMFFSSLEDAGFTFVDMQRIRIARRLKISTGAKARLVVRDLMQKSVIQLARAQPDFSERLKVRFLGGIGADFYEPRPTWAQISLGLNFNGIESYFGVYLGDWRKFRLDIGGRFYELGPVSYTDPSGVENRLFTSDAAAFARLSFAVAEGALARLEFGLGFIGSERFAWAQSADKTHVVFRYGPELTGSISLLRHFYLDAQLDFFVDGCGGQLGVPEEHCLKNRKGHPEGEVKMLNRDWRFSLGAGWRWNL